MGLHAVFAGAGTQQLCGPAPSAPAPPIVPPLTWPQVWRGAAGAAAGQGLARAARAAHDGHPHPAHPGGFAGRPACHACSCAPWPVLAALETPLPSPFRNCNPPCTLSRLFCFFSAGSHRPRRHVAHHHPRPAQGALPRGDARPGGQGAPAGAGGGARASWGALRPGPWALPCSAARQTALAAWLWGRQRLRCGCRPKRAIISRTRRGWAAVSV